MNAGSSHVVRRGRPFILSALALCAIAVPTVASAHLERPSYWPDPTADQAGGQPTGGKVPKARSLGTAVSGKGPGQVRVVCQEDSLSLAKASIKSAKKQGFRLRPSQPKKKLSKSEADKLLKHNKKFAQMCDFDSVQDAINASGNNDRVVIMPGRYTEPESREAPVNDPECNPSLLQEDQSGALTPSYEYQATCPNDQNLIYVQGRAVKGEPLAEPDPDRHGIPEQELGDCIRCNLQIEGSGAKPEDVVLDAGNNYADPEDPDSRPGSGNDTSPEDCLAAPDGPDNPCYAKHVVMRTDRSDGFVGRNFLMKGAKEHGFYTEETDGILLNKVKFFWNADYGHLSFTTDHNMIKNCDGYGSGDAVIYPGASPQTGEFRDEEFYPEERYNTVVKKCDLHGSAMGYSGSMGNSVRVTKNNFYGNANGLTTDTISAPGHPGFPADGMKVDNNMFYSNNLNVYADENLPFVPLVPQAVGTGIMWPGHNNGDFTKNMVFDNWQYGTFLIAIPDVIAGEAEGNVDSETHCLFADQVVPGSPSGASTSCDNRYYDNKMGQVPKGFKPHPGLDMFGNQSGLLDSEVPKELPNGLDHYWDEYLLSDGNCWYDNTGPDGTRDSLTADPPLNPLAPGTSLIGFLPEACSQDQQGSLAYAAKAVLLLECFAEWESGTAPDGPCTWFELPPRPGTARAAAEQAEREKTMKEIAKSPEAERIGEYFKALRGSVDLGPGD